MVSIVADNQDVERCLEKILETAKRGGAEFEEALVLRCSEGSLSIELAPESAAVSLMKLPGRLLVPVGSFHLSLEADNIVIRDVDPVVSAERRTLMESILELYNLTNKIAWFRRTSPALMLRSFPDLARMLDRGQGAPISQQIELLAADKIDHFVLRRFFATRWFGFIEASDIAATRVLMPILDLMNHHSQGSAYEIRVIDGDRWLHLHRAKSELRGQRECYALYNECDAMEMLWAYHFVDESAAFVRSVPMEIRLPDAGVLKINATKARTRGKDLPPAIKDISAYLPKVVSRRPGFLEVSCVMIPSARMPFSLRRVLNVLIGTLNSESLDRPDLIAQAESQIIQTNESYYTDLQKMLRNLTLAEGDNAQILQALARACELQLSHLRNYLSIAGSAAA